MYRLRSPDLIAERDQPFIFGRTPRVPMPMAHTLRLTRIGTARAELRNTSKDRNPDRIQHFWQLKSVFCGVWVLRLSFSGTIFPLKYSGTSSTTRHQ